MHDAQDWIEDPEGEHKRKFAKLSVAKFKAHIRDTAQAQRAKLKRRTEEAERRAEEAEENERKKERKRAKKEKKKAKELNDSDHLD